MSRRTETCVVWTCDDCNDEYGEDDGTIHLTVDEAPAGWETIDGKDVCEECFRRECAKKGHDWSEWVSSYWPPEGAEEYRRCIRCSYIGGARPGLYVWADAPLCKARRGGNMCTRAEGHDGRHSWTAL